MHVMQRDWRVTTDMLLQINERQYEMQSRKEHASADARNVTDICNKKCKT